MTLGSVRLVQAGSSGDIRGWKAKPVKRREERTVSGSLICVFVLVLFQASSATDVGFFSAPMLCRMQFLNS